MTTRAALLKAGPKAGPTDPLTPNIPRQNRGYGDAPGTIARETNAMIAWIDTGKLGSLARSIRPVPRTLSEIAALENKLRLQVLRSTHEAERVFRTTGVHEQEGKKARRGANPGDANDAAERAIKQQSYQAALKIVSQTRKAAFDKASQLVEAHLKAREKALDAIGATEASRLMPLSLMLTTQQRAGLPAVEAEMSAMLPLDVLKFLSGRLDSTDDPKSLTLEFAAYQSTLLSLLQKPAKELAVLFTKTTSQAGRASEQRQALFAIKKLTEKFRDRVVGDPEAIKAANSILDRCRTLGITLFGMDCRSGGPVSSHHFEYLMSNNQIGKLDRLQPFFDAFPCRFAGPEASKSKIPRWQNPPFAVEA